MQFFRKKYQSFLFFFFLANIIALLNFSVIVSTQLTEGRTPNYFLHAIFEITGSYSFFSLIPLMLLLFNNYPLKKNELYIRIPMYFLVAGVLGIIHTYIMYSARTIIFETAGWGTYDPGNFSYRILMETIKLLLGFWILFGIYSLVKTNREKHEENLRAVKLEEELLKNRLQVLQAQINPHFLFNTLNMISSVMYEDAGAADTMIANLSDLLRITINGANKGLNRLQNEIDILILYINIMKARFGERLHVELNIEENTKSALVPNFLFQPLVENSIKFGMENLSGTQVWVTTYLRNENLEIQIKDNGPGIQNIGEAPIKNGIGLSNTVNRLQNLYGNKSKLEIISPEEGGLLLKITLPFTESEVKK